MIDELIRPCCQVGLLPEDVDTIRAIMQVAACLKKDSSSGSLSITSTDTTGKAKPGEIFR